MHHPSTHTPQESDEPGYTESLPNNFRVHLRSKWILASERQKMKEAGNRIGKERLRPQCISDGVSVNPVGS